MPSAIINPRGDNMARTKQLNTVLTYVGTPYVVNDLGETKTPRFELYNTETHSVKLKSNNPLDFDKIIFGDGVNAEFSEESTKPKRGRKRKNQGTN